MNEESNPEIGECILFHPEGPSEGGRPPTDRPGLPALVTEVFDRDPVPMVNLVYVDPDQETVYGKAVERETSVRHFSDASPGEKAWE